MRIFRLPPPFTSSLHLHFFFGGGGEGEIQGEKGGNRTELPPDVESLLLLDGCTLLIGGPTLDVVAEDRSKVENDVISPGDTSEAGFLSVEIDEDGGILSSRTAIRTNLENA